MSVCTIYLFNIDTELAHTKMTELLREGKQDRTAYEV